MTFPEFRETEALQRKIVEMKRSVSWRITSPLREVNRLFKRIFSSEYRSERRALRRTGRSLKVGETALPYIGSIFKRSSYPVAANSSPKAAAECPELVTAAECPELVYVIGCWPGESKRYRVFNAADVLVSAGYKVEILREEDMGRIAAEGWRPTAIVFFRLPDSRLAQECHAYARRHDINTFYDIDDLVFEPSIVTQVDGFNLLPDHEQILYTEGVRRYRKFMLQTDAVITTTASLASAASALNKPTHIITNTFNTLQRDNAERLIKCERGTHERVTIAYFSGSRTHNKDFAVAAPALLRLLAEFPQLRLLIVGELDFDGAFEQFASKIDRMGFMPYLDMQDVIVRSDINIAPLVIGNPFNDAKSELKWFEAALLGVPSVVSRTEPYRLAVREGETGLLAGNASEWYEKLKILILDQSLRRCIGEKARQETLIHWGPEALSASLQNLLPPPAQKRAAVEQTASRKKIDWIVPGLLIGGGGHRNILRAAYFLEQFGHDVGLVFTNVTQSPAVLRALIHKHFYPFRGQIRVYDGIFRYSDVLFATHWSTVYPALDAAGMTREVMYFIQDFEPMFAPMSSEYIMAENTYRKGLYGICSGPWCAHKLNKEFNADVDYFEFPIDREVYYPRSRLKENLNILFFAKPDMPRRCYELGVATLAELHRLMPNLEIIFFGSQGVDVKRLGFPVTLKGLLPTINDLAQAYSDADLGIAFSTTNPSLVPYEIMACGTPVVDLDRAENEVNYGGSRDVALLADPEPKIMARQIAALLQNRKEREERKKNGLDLTARMPNEIEMAKRVEALILKRLARYE